MKEYLAKLVPEPARPFAQALYWRMVARPSVSALSTEQYASLRALKCCVSYNKYGGYCVPESSSHRPAAQAILSKTVYEPRTIEFMTARCGDGDIVHAGTYFGDFLPALSKACASDRKVWAFEPNNENFRCANITLLINDIHNVELMNAGLGERVETLTMGTVDANGEALGGGSRVVSQPSDSSKGLQSVEIFPIDNVVPQDRHVSIVQLDVEGYEEKALRGAIKTIRRCLPILILEDWPGSNLVESKWFSENLSPLRYTAVDQIHGNIVLNPNKQR